MINPNYVIDAVINVLKTNKVSIGINDAIELSEDSYSIDMKPPYAGVYANFSEDAVSKSSDGICFQIPVDIVVVFFSSEKSTSQLSFKEAFNLANAALPLIRKSYSIINMEENPELVNVVLISKIKPFNILHKSADQSIVEVNLQYVDDSF